MDIIPRVSTFVSGRRAKMQIKQRLTTSKEVKWKIVEEFKKPEKWFEKLLYKLCKKLGLIEDAELKHTKFFHEDILLESIEDLDKTILSLYCSYGPGNWIILAGYKEMNNLMVRWPAFYSQTFYEDTEQYDGRRVSTKYKNIPVSCVPYLEGYLVINKEDL